MYVCMYKGTKVRPTVGGPKCPTRKLSELIITLLKPLLKHVKSYTRDSIYFLTCGWNIDWNAVIATFDEVSLYINIPHTSGLKVLLSKYEEDIHPRFNKLFILKSSDFILKNNISLFDNEYCLQLQGTAMGTVFAPTSANNICSKQYLIRE